MSILPTFIETHAGYINTVVEIPKEYGINYETGQLTGDVVEGLEAIKVWIWLCLRVERFIFPIYTWTYGTELEQYIGKVMTDEYLQDDCRGNIEEALTVNPWITGISDFNASVKGEHLSMSFAVNTKLGEVHIEV